MKVMKKILRWLVDFGLKCITKLVRTASAMAGTPKTKLPTERDVIWELGTTAAKAVAKSKCQSWWSKVVEPIRCIVRRCTPSRTRVSLDTGELVIDV